MSSSNDFFGKLFSGITRIFTPPSSERLQRPPKNPAVSKPVQMKKPEILYLPKISEEDIILARKPEDMKTETLIARLIPSLSALCARKAGIDEQAFESRIQSFASAKCYYFKDTESQSGRPWSDICMESYHRVFEIFPDQADKIPSIARKHIQRFKDTDEVTSFMFECVLFCIDLASIEATQQAFAEFKFLGMDSKQLASSLKKVRKSKKKLRLS